MSAVPSRWDDLGPRLGVGSVIAAIALLFVWLGGWLFMLLTVAICAVLVWELVRMIDPQAPAVMLAGTAGLALLVLGLVPSGWALPLLIAPAFIGIGQMNEHRLTFVIFTTTILLAGFGLLILREEFGFVWMLWLSLVVAFTDVFGYFAGRFIGGPKFWPRISPKKTWSGTVAGWIGAAVLAVIFIGVTGASGQLIGLSIATSMASQFGDIAESSVKRRMDVKDSSSLLPGHGGLFDRFDGMLGASVFVLLVGQLVDFPPGLM